MRSAAVKCVHCSAIYSIFEPDFMGNVPNEGDKVSTEIGCPKCLCPDGVLFYIDPPDLPKARYIGSVATGTQFVAPE